MNSPWGNDIFTIITTEAENVNRNYVTVPRIVDRVLQKNGNIWDFSERMNLLSSQVL
jgi:hypothetical protein